MQVNLNGATPDPILSQKNNETPAQASQVAGQNGNDTATLSLGQDQTGALVSQTMATPDMRLDKIEALRQSISSGDYKIEPDKIADAMLNESAKTESGS
jgi:flagellar biosynthesis anti-sigma factor FlgM